MAREGRVGGEGGRAALKQKAEISFIMAVFIARQFKDISALSQKRREGALRSCAIYVSLSPLRTSG